MPFNVKQRGKLTYYYQGDRPVLSALVTEEQGDGDLKIYFAGLTGGYSAKGVLGLDEREGAHLALGLEHVDGHGSSWRCRPAPCRSLDDTSTIGPEQMTRQHTVRHVQPQCRPRCPGGRDGAGRHLHLQ